MGRTKDESFIVHAYEAAKKMDDIHMELDRYEIGRQCGLSPKAVDAICKLLHQSNFIRKVGSSAFFLTTNGEALALRLLGEKR